MSVKGSLSLANRQGPWVELQLEHEDRASINCINPSDLGSWFEHRIAGHEYHLRAFKFAHNAAASSINRKLPREVLVEIFALLPLKGSGYYEYRHSSTSHTSSPTGIGELFGETRCTTDISSVPAPCPLRVKRVVHPNLIRLDIRNCQTAITKEILARLAYPPTCHVSLKMYSLRDVLPAGPFAPASMADRVKVHFLHSGSKYCPRQGGPDHVYSRL
ncbi:hypothetical protein K466DRAFT_190390 [Polyporus arcularius HHB13444]|uniref:Uncharacterized protein n=1 Tax=Polyporus arcularius HHB13444 TaxID=1314778 RepID=A0A5C3P6T3_9APHY|nr:hypothetical protein K466DRAFT_190390 [Polyporus arcularius HHB13444]